MRPHLSQWVVIALAGLAYGHQVPWHRSMWCLNGTTPGAEANNRQPTHPLYKLRYEDYWMNNVHGCGGQPPPPGAFLEVPAGGEFTVEIAENRRFTTLDGPGAILSAWPDGRDYPDDYNDPDCIKSPNLHTHNESTAAGTAFAISYNSDYNTVRPEEFVVFTVLANTPWKRIATYQVPRGMPLCDPVKGCLCLFGWIALNCGERNMFMNPYRCKVIADDTPTKIIGKPQPAKYCRDDPSTCVTGPKIPMIWHQLEGNNIEVEEYGSYGLKNTPGYNSGCGFTPGAQDIFVDDPADAMPMPNYSAVPAVSSTVPASTTAGDPPAASGAPTSSGSSLPVTNAGTSALPASVPTSSASDPGPSVPTTNGTSSVPSSVPTSDPTVSSTSTGEVCSSPTQTVPATHSKRMITRREKHNFF